VTRASTPLPSTPTPVPAKPSHSTQLAASDGGSLAVPDLGLSLSVPAGALGGQDAALQVEPITTQPGPNAGFMAGDRAFELSISSSSTGEQLTSFPAPIVLEYAPSAAELALANGDLSRVSLSYWDGSAWVPVPCSPSGQQLACTLTHMSLFQLMISPLTLTAQDYDLADLAGHFYRQTNGFDGSGEAGYAITDDAEAPLWTEFQRLGGVEALGYPVSNRFTYQGLPTQVFQKAALQWQPDLEMAVPVDVFDNVNPATDAWLDMYRQVPPSPEWSTDANQDWDQVVVEHESLLDAFPPLHDLYFSDPDPVMTYGLPLSVRQYDSMVVVRTQRAVLQLWTVDTPWAAAGTVVVGNAGDIAKEAGLWPSQAIIPQLPPTAETPEVALDN